MFNRSLRSILFGSYIIAACSSSFADDTEIFTGNAEGADGDSVANIMFVMDTSGSMDWSVNYRSNAGLGDIKYDSPKRINVMKAGLQAVLDSLSNNVNVGLMRFTYPGGPVLFPVSNLNAREAETAADIQVSQDGVETEIAGSDTGDFVGRVVLQGEFIAMPDGNGGGGGPGNGVDISKRVSSDSDDAHQCDYGGYFDNSQPFLSFNAYPGYQCNRDVGIRFTNLNIPQGQNIEKVELVLTAADDLDEDATVVIYLEDNADGNTFSADGDNRVLPDRPFVRNNQGQIISVPWQLNQDRDEGKKDKSPDLSELVQAVVDRSDWNSSDNSLVFLIYSSGGYITNGESRPYWSRDGKSSKSPKIKITFGEATEVIERVAGIRFDGVRVPQGATVTDARIALTSFNDTGRTSNAIVTMDAATDSAVFTDADEDFTSRARNATDLNVNIPVLNQDEGFEIDVTDFINAKVANENWCGGNAVSFFIENGGEHQFYSLEGDQQKAAVLRLNIDPSSVDADPGCNGGLIQAQVLTSDDDVSETSGQRDFVQDDLEIAPGKFIGLRFQGVNVPEQPQAVGASPLTIIAKLKLHTEATSFAQSEFKVWAQANGADSFQDDVNSLNSRNATNEYVVTLPAIGDLSSIPVDDRFVELDVSAVVSELIGLDTWEDGNGMVFVLEGVSGSIPFTSHDFSANLAPGLNVRYQGDIGNSGRTVRERIKQLVADLPASGGTPINSTLYEAARYFRGEKVEFGLDRNERSSARVSTSLSWQGQDAAVVRDAGCTDTNLDSSSCSSEHIVGEPNYISPIQAACQSNNIVLLSDGEPTTPSSVFSGTGVSLSNRVADLTGNDSDYSCSNGSSFGCANSVASYIHNDGINTINTYTIGLSLDSVGLRDLAEVHGGGSYYTADNIDSLVGAFQQIIGNILETDSTIAAPGVAVNQLNRFRHLNQLYYSIFRPTERVRWSGNLKRYRLDSGDPSNDVAPAIVDRYNLPAVGTAVSDDGEASNSSFLADSVSFWNDIRDGGSANIGGAAATIPHPDDRNLYTYTGAYPVPDNSAGASEEATEAIDDLAFVLLDTADGQGDLINPDNLTTALDDVTSDVATLAQSIVAADNAVAVYQSALGDAVAVALALEQRQDELAEDLLQAQQLINTAQGIVPSATALSSAIASALARAEAAANAARDIYTADFNLRISQIASDHAKGDRFFVDVLDTSTAKNQLDQARQDWLDATDEVAQRRFNSLFAEDAVDSTRLFNLDGFADYVLPADFDVDDFVGQPSYLDQYVNGVIGDLLQGALNLKPGADLADLNLNDTNLALANSTLTERTPDPSETSLLNNFDIAADNAGGVTLSNANAADLALQFETTSKDSADLAAAVPSPALTTEQQILDQAVLDSTAQLSDVIEADAALIYSDVATAQLALDNATPSPSTQSSRGQLGAAAVAASGVTLTAGEAADSYLANSANIVSAADATNAINNAQGDAAYGLYDQILGDLTNNLPEPARLAEISASPSAVVLDSLPSLNQATQTLTDNKENGFEVGRDELLAAQVDAAEVSSAVNGLNSLDVLPTALEAEALQQSVPDVVALLNSLQSAFDAANDVQTLSDAENADLYQQGLVGFIEASDTLQPAIIQLEKAQELAGEFGDVLINKPQKAEEVQQEHYQAAGTYSANGYDLELASVSDLGTAKADVDFAGAQVGEKVDASLALNATKAAAVINDANLSVDGVLVTPDNFRELLTKSIKENLPGDESALRSLAENTVLGVADSDPNVVNAINATASEAVLAFAEGITQAVAVDVVAKAEAVDKADDEEFPYLLGFFFAPGTPAFPGLPPFRGCKGAALTDPACFEDLQEYHQATKDTTRTRQEHVQGVELNAYQDAFSEFKKLAVADVANANFILNAQLTADGLNLKDAADIASAQAALSNGFQVAGVTQQLLAANAIDNAAVLAELSAVDPSVTDIGEFTAAYSATLTDPSDPSAIDLSILNSAVSNAINAAATTSTSDTVATIKQTAADALRDSFDGPGGVIDNIGFVETPTVQDLSNTLNNAGLTGDRAAVKLAQQEIFDQVVEFSNTGSAYFVQQTQNSVAQAALAVAQIEASNATFAVETEQFSDSLNDIGNYNAAAADETQASVYADYRSLADQELINVGKAENTTDFANGVTAQAAALGLVGITADNLQSKLAEAFAAKDTDQTPYSQLQQVLRSAVDNVAEQSVQTSTADLINQAESNVLTGAKQQRDAAKANPNRDLITDTDTLLTSYQAREADLAIAQSFDAIQAAQTNLASAANDFVVEQQKVNLKLAAQNQLDASTNVLALAESAAANSAFLVAAQNFHDQEQDVATNNDPILHSAEQAQQKNIDFAQFNVDATVQLGDVLDDIADETKLNEVIAAQSLAAGFTASSVTELAQRLGDAVASQSVLSEASVRAAIAAVVSDIAALDDQDTHTVASINNDFAQALSATAASNVLSLASNEQLTKGTVADLTTAQADYDSALQNLIDSTPGQSQVLRTAVVDAAANLDKVRDERSQNLVATAQSEIATQLSKRALSDAANTNFDLQLSSLDADFSEASFTALADASEEKISSQLVSDFNQARADAFQTATDNAPGASTSEILIAAIGALDFESPKAEVAPGTVEALATAKLNWDVGVQALSDASTRAAIGLAQAELSDLGEQLDAARDQRLLALAQDRKNSDYDNLLVQLNADLAAAQFSSNASTVADSYNENDFSQLQSDNQQLASSTLVQDFEVAKAQALIDAAASVDATAFNNSLAAQNIDVNGTVLDASNLASLLRDSLALGSVDQAGIQSALTQAIAATATAEKSAAAITKLGLATLVGPEPAGFASPEAPSGIDTTTILSNALDDYTASLQVLADATSRTDINAAQAAVKDFSQAVINAREAELGESAKLAQAEVYSNLLAQHLADTQNAQFLDEAGNLNAVYSESAFVDQLDAAKVQAASTLINDFETAKAQAVVDAAKDADETVFVGSLAAQNISINGSLLTADTLSNELSSALAAGETATVQSIRAALDTALAAAATTELSSSAIVANGLAAVQLSYVSPNKPVVDGTEANLISAKSTWDGSFTSLADTSDRTALNAAQAGSVLAGENLSQARDAHQTQVAQQSTNSTFDLLIAQNQADQANASFVAQAGLLDQKIADKFDFISSFENKLQTPILPDDVSAAFDDDLNALFNAQFANGVSVGKDDAAIPGTAPALENVSDKAGRRYDEIVTAQASAQTDLDTAQALVGAQRDKLDQAYQQLQNASSRVEIAAAQQAVTDAAQLLTQAYAAQAEPLGRVLALNAAVADAAVDYAQTTPSALATATAVQSNAQVGFVSALREFSEASSRDDFVSAKNTAISSANGEGVEQQLTGTANLLAQLPNLPNGSLEVLSDAELESSGGLSNDVVVALSALRDKQLANTPPDSLSSEYAAIESAIRFDLASLAETRVTKETELAQAILDFGSESSQVQDAREGLAQINAAYETAVDLQTDVVAKQLISEASILRVTGELNQLSGNYEQANITRAEAGSIANETIHQQVGLNEQTLTDALSAPQQSPGGTGELVLDELNAPNGLFDQIRASFGQLANASDDVDAVLSDVLGSLNAADSQAQSEALFVTSLQEKVDSAQLAYSDALAQLQASEASISTAQDQFGDAESALNAFLNVDGIPTDIAVLGDIRFIPPGQDNALITAKVDSFDNAASSLSGLKVSSIAETTLSNAVVEKNAARDALLSLSEDDGGYAAALELFNTKSEAVENRLDNITENGGDAQRALKFAKAVALDTVAQNQFAALESGIVGNQDYAAALSAISSAQETLQAELDSIRPDMLAVNALQLDLIARQQERNVLFVALTETRLDLTDEQRAAAQQISDARIGTEAVLQDLLATDGLVISAQAELRNAEHDLISAKAGFIETLNGYLEAQSAFQSAQSSSAALLLARVELDKAVAQQDYLSAQLVNALATQADAQTLLDGANAVATASIAAAIAVETAAGADSDIAGTIAADLEAAKLALFGDPTGDQNPGALAILNALELEAKTAAQELVDQRAANRLYHEEQLNDALFTGPVAELIGDLRSLQDQLVVALALGLSQVELDNLQLQINALRIEVDLAYEELNVELLQENYNTALDAYVEALEALEDLENNPSEDVALARAALAQAQYEVDFLTQLDDSTADVLLTAGQSLAAAADLAEFNVDTLLANAADTVASYPLAGSVVEQDINGDLVSAYNAEIAQLTLLLVGLDGDSAIVDAALAAIAADLGVAVNDSRVLDAVHEFSQAALGLDDEDSIVGVNQQLAQAQAETQAAQNIQIETNYVSSVPGQSFEEINDDFQVTEAEYNARRLTVGRVFDSGGIPLNQTSNLLRNDNGAVRPAAGLGEGFEAKNIINWARGYDIPSTSTTSDTTGVEARQEMGAPLHSTPLLVNFGNDENGVPKEVVFVSTNEGYLHAFDTNINGNSRENIAGGTSEANDARANGVNDEATELFAFMPKELLTNLSRLKSNPTGKLIYGLDAPWSYYRRDGNSDFRITGEGTFDNPPNAELVAARSVPDAVYLYGGMRRGGSNYYALNVTDPTDPRLKFVIGPGQGAVEADNDAFANIGQTWSQPVISKMRFPVPGGSEQAYEDRIVMVFGGGYDPSHDINSSAFANTGTTLGNSVYIVDASTGELLWWAGDTSSGASIELPEMDYSIPSQVTVVDLDGDRLLDFLYVGDMGGQVLRFNIQPDATSASNLFTGKVLAKLGHSSGASLATNRRFFEPPSITIVNDEPREELLKSIAAADANESALALAQENRDAAQALTETDNSVEAAEALTEAESILTAVQQEITESGVVAADFSDAERIVEKRYVAVTIGSGYRAHPLDKSAQEMFFMLEDNEVLSLKSTTNPEGVGQNSVPALTLTDLDDVTLKVDEFALLKSGWFLQLREVSGSVTTQDVVVDGVTETQSVIDVTPGSYVGEKVLSKAIVVNDRVLFTTYVPSALARDCDPVVGGSRFYAVNIFNGAPLYNVTISDDTAGVGRYVDNFAGGIVSNPQVVFGDSDVILLAGLEADSATNGAIDFDLTVDIGEVRKTRWRQRGYAETHADIVTFTSSE